ncbi:hypothetical protein ES707_13094 [subsurface metagenome]
MKRKTFSILIAVAFVAGLILIPAAPAAAATTYNVRPYTLYSGATYGTAVWSTDQHSTGSASVLLTHDAANAGSDYVQFVPNTGVTLADLGAATATSEWSWQHFTPATLNNWSQMELRFTQPGGDADIVLDVTAMPLQNHTGSGAWDKQELVQATTGLLYYGTNAAGTGYSWEVAGGGDGILKTVADIIAAIRANVGADADAVLDDLVLTRVRVELWEASNRVCYIDDITIAGTTYYGLIGDAIDSNAVDDDIISVAAGTYSAETSWPIDINHALTIQSVSDAANTIITPGAAGRGVIAITVDNVTIDGFTITHGTETADATHPTEHTVWVDAQYSTIEGNTILTRGGNKAGIYIGGRADPDTESLFLYNQTQPLGHTIQDNIFRNANAGEGWGIFAYEIKDSLIHGNTFSGDAAWTTNTVEGAPGTGIIIRAASAATGDPSPGGGSVIIEDNTAQYIKYTWLTFSPHFMFVDNAGAGYEKVEASAVGEVIVRNNTVSDSDVGVTFKPSFIDGSPYADAAASLTIHADLVTIGPGNNFHDVYKGVDIDDPDDELGGIGGFGGSSYYLVEDANNIIINYNDFVDASSHGVYNGMYWADLSVIGAGPLTIDAKYNYWGDESGPTVATASGSIIVNDRGTGDTLNSHITYEPWLHTTQATVVAANTRYYAYNLCELTQGWNIWSTPIALDEQAATWGDYKALGVDLALTNIADGPNAYYFINAGPTQSWAQPGADYVLRPCDAIYVKMASDQVSPILFSPTVSAPSKMLYPGWNLVSASYFADLAAPVISGEIAVEDALASVYYATGASNIGYSVVTSPAVNQAAWSVIRLATISADLGTDDMIPTKGYWVHMVNGGTLVGEVFTPISPLLP